MLRVSTIRDIEQWPTADWPGIPRGSYYSSPAWLRCAKVATDGEVGAVAVYDGDELVAVAPFWRTTGRENPARRPADLLCDVGLTGKAFLVAGTSTAYLSELLVADEDRRYAAAGPIVETIRTLADEYDVDGCLALYADERSAAAYLAATRGRVPVLLDAEAIIPVPGTFREYPVGVASKHRQRLHKEWRTFSEAGYDLSVEHLVDCADEFAPLMANLERRHGNDIEDGVLLHTLRTQAALCGANDLVFCARRHGRLIAASLCYHASDTLIVRCFGQEFHRVETRYVYFALVYYLPMQYAIERRMRNVSVGISTLRAKVYRGARLNRLWAVDLNHSPLWAAEDAERVNRQTESTLLDR